MITLDAGNVLLKPSHRRLMHTSLRRCEKFLARLGKTFLRIGMHRVGRSFELRAEVRGCRSCACRVRSSDWRGAWRQLVRTLADQLHRFTLFPSPA